MKTASIARLHELFIYDPDTGVLTNRINRRRARAGEEAGNLRSDGYRNVILDYVTFKVHRVVWAMHFGVWPSGLLDHVDGNPSNNRISNLRPATHVQNMRNRRKHKNNTSGIKGVRKNRNGSKWAAYIQIDGKNTNLGSFDSAEEAADAYRKASLELHGDFANFG